MSIDFKSINRHRGDFTKKARAAGMGVQEYAGHVLANTGNYDTRTVRQASFAKAAKKFKHAFGGNMYQDGGERQSGYMTPYRRVSRIAHDVAQNSAADFVARLNDADRLTIPDFEHPDGVATHKMSSGVVGADGRRRGIVYPTVQNIDGRLVDFNDPANASYGDPYRSAIERGDYFLTPNGRSARRFAADRYKMYFPSGTGFACGGGMRRFDDGGNMVEYDEGNPTMAYGVTDDGGPYYPLQVPGGKAHGGLIRPYADGGELAHTHGSWWPSGLQYVDEGGTHEQNPNDGVLMGVDGQGTPNLVEEGEVIYDGYVFSNRFGPTADELQSAGLPASYAGSSYALIAEKLGRDVALRPNDAISRRGLDANMSRLIGLQEAYRESHGMNADAVMPGMEGEAMDEAAHGPALPYGMEAPPEGRDEWRGQAPEEEMMQGQGAALEYPDMGGGVPFTGAYGGRMPRLYEKGGRENFADFLQKIKYERPEGYVQIDDGKWMTKDDKGYDVSVDYDEDAAINKWAQETAEGVDWGSFKRSGIRSAIAGLTKGEQENPAATAALQNALNSSYAQYMKDSSGWDRFGQAIGVSPDEKGIYKTGMRYAPMLANAGNAIYNLARRPDMREARAYEDIARNIKAPQERAGQLGEYMSYSPIDVNRALNAARASAGATRRSMNGLNAGQSNGLNLAAGYNEQRAVGQTMADIYKQNLDMRKAVAEFNRMTNATNIQNDMAAQTTNAANRMAADKRREDLLQTAAKTRSTERADLSRARLESIGKVATDLGSLGKENFAYNQARSNPALHGYWADKDGNMHYSGTLDEARVDPMLLMMLQSDPEKVSGREIFVGSEKFYVHPVYDKDRKVVGVDFKKQPYVPSGDKE